jgi:hypothetical protein
MLSLRWVFGLSISVLCGGVAYAVYSGTEPHRDALTAPFGVDSNAPLSSDHRQKPTRSAEEKPPATGNTGNPSTAPLKWAGLFYGEAKAGGFVCTAQFIAPRIILTAAHCIQDNLTGEWYDRTKMQFYLQYQNKSYSHRYNVVCAARLNSWIPAVGANATDQEKFIAIQEAYQYDFAMIFLDGESTTGIFRVALDAAGKYGLADEIGYPGAILGGKVIQEDNGFLGLRFFPANVMALWHFNENMTEGTSGGAWIANPDSNEGPQNNVLVGLTSFGNEKLWPRTTFGPYLRKDYYTKLFGYVSNGCR